MENALLKALIEPLLIIAVVGGMLYLNSLFFQKVKVFTSKERTNLWKGLVSLFIVLLGIVVFILSLPISNELKGQILSLFGIVISAGIALSSTTLLGNLLAGIMNNSESRFKSGDLIEIENIHGRVTKRSFFYTEIQSEDSNFITIPNLFLATKPIKNTRKSDAVIATTVSLGYDVSRKLIEDVLKKAAIDAGLQNPYVYIISLGDFSVVYKIHGFLEDTDKYFSTRHYLNKQVIDALHNKDIEIVSPTFMNQRKVDDKVFISKIYDKNNDKIDDSHEDQVFDKAKSYEELEEQTGQLKKALQTTKDKEQKERIKEKIEDIEEQREKLDTKKDIGQ